MLGVGIAKAAVFLHFHTVGVLFLVLGGGVVALLARHTGQCNLGAHINPSLSFACSNFSHQKSACALGVE